MKAAILPVLLFGLVTVASADDLKSQIETENAAVAKTMMNKDLAGFTKAVRDMVTPNFKYVEGKTTLTFDQMIAGVKQGFAAVTKYTSTYTKVLKVDVKGNDATALVVHRMTGVTVGPDKKPTSYSFDGVSVDGYHLDGGKWKMATMSWKSSTVRVGGHLVKMGM